ncbi:MAG: TonB-dependent receptor [Opitutales bacterium]|nr:TonB-dependent receptor [Opitutales bacterium]
MQKPSTHYKSLSSTPLSSAPQLRPLTFFAIAGLTAMCPTTLFSQTDLDKNEGIDDNVMLLDPFEVVSDKDVGYLATASLSGSRLNTEMRDIAAAVQAITPEFMKDVGATDLKKLLLYTTSTEVGGLDGNFYGGDSWDKGYANKMLVEPSKSTRIRGLNNADVTRDFFPSDIPIDWYSLSRVDISRGPNAVLFGLGSPAGLINNTLKVPNMAQDTNTFEFKFDNYGSKREMLDVDQTIIPGELGIRVVGLYDDAKFRQNYTWNRDRRIYAAARYQPDLAEGIFTQIDVNGEWGQIKGNRPVSTTPADFLSNWYGAANRITVENDEYWSSNGFADIENVYASQTLGGQLWDDHAVSFFSDPNGSSTGVPGDPQAMLVRGYSNVNGGGWGSWVGLINPNWEVNNPNHEKYSAAYYANNPVVSEIISNYEAQTGKTFSGFGAGLWPTQMIVDGPIAELMKEQNLIGPNKSEFNNFETFNAQITQSYWEGRVGWNFAYNKQSYRSGYTNLMEGLWGMNVVSIDINESLRNSDDANNPNLGRLYTFGEGRGAIWEKERENWRFTGYLNLKAEDFMNPDSLLTKIIGEHTFTGVRASQRYENFDRNFKLYAWEPAYIEALTNGNSTGYATWRAVHYLSDSMLDTTSMDQISGMTGIGVVQTPELTQNVLAYTNGAWTTSSFDLISWENDIDKLYDGASQGYDTTKSNVLVWQGNMFDGVIVPIFGWREDDYERWNKPSTLVKDGTYNYVLPYSSDWNYDDVTPIRAKEQRRSWSVALHVRELLQWFDYELPKGTDITILYNNSSSFRPSDVAVDVYGNQEATPSGDTEDVSVMVSTLDNRLSFRITKYKTVQKNTPFIGTSPAFNANKAILGRAMDGMMWEIGSWAGANAEDRVQPTPEWLVNKWMFGDNYDESIANTPLPSNWRDIPDILNQPLRIRESAVPGSASYVAQGTINPDTDLVYVAPPLTADEVAYRTEWFKARSDAEWSRPVDQEFWSAMNFTRNYSADWGGFWETTAWEIPQSMKSLNDLESTGTEYEVTANILPNWRITLNASRAEAVRSNVLNSWDEYIEKNIDFWFDGGYSLNDAPAMDYWSFQGFYDIVQSPGNTLGLSGRLGTQYGAEILNAYYQAKATENQMVNELRKWHFNLVTNYTFDSGPLKGVGIGGAYRWMDNSNIGYYPKYDADANAWVNDMDKPIQGPAEDYVDFWVSYQRDITEKINWSIQLNVYNLFPDDSFIPIQANPDGSIAQVRIPGETTWSISNVIRF